MRTKTKATEGSGGGTRPRVGTLFLACLLLLAPGCESSTQPLVDRPPELEGTIEEYEGEFSLVARFILVKETPQEECGTVVTVRAVTRLRAQDDRGRTGEASRSDLVPGTRVRVWFDGPVLDTCPAQGIAEAVELLW
jgi:hypothetical protein